MIIYTKLIEQRVCHEMFDYINYLILMVIFYNMMGIMKLNNMRPLFPFYPATFVFNDNKRSKLLLDRIGDSMVCIILK